MGIPRARSGGRRTLSNRAERNDDAIYAYLGRAYSAVEKGRGGGKQKRRQASELTCNRFAHNGTRHICSALRADVRSAFPFRLSFFGRKMSAYIPDNAAYPYHLHPLRILQELVLGQKKFLGVFIYRAA